MSHDPEASDSLTPIARGDPVLEPLRLAFADLFIAIAGICLCALAATATVLDMIPAASPLAVVQAYGAGAALIAGAKFLRDAQGETAALAAWMAVVVGAFWMPCLAARHGYWIT